MPVKVVFDDSLVLSDHDDVSDKSGGIDIVAVGVNSKCNIREMFEKKGLKSDKSAVNSDKSADNNVPKQVALSVTSSSSAGNSFTKGAGGVGVVGSNITLGEMAQKIEQVAIQASSTLVDEQRLDGQKTQIQHQSPNQNTNTINTQYGYMGNYSPTKTSKK